MYVRNFGHATTNWFSNSVCTDLSTQENIAENYPENFTWSDDKQTHSGFGLLKFACQETEINIHLESCPETKLYVKIHSTVNQQKSESNRIQKTEINIHLESRPEIKSVC